MALAMVSPIWLVNYDKHNIAKSNNTQDINAPQRTTFKTTQTSKRRKHSTAQHTHTRYKTHNTHYTQYTQHTERKKKERHALLNSAKNVSGGPLHLLRHRQLRPKPGTPGYVASTKSGACWLSSALQPCRAQERGVSHKRQATLP